MLGWLRCSAIRERVLMPSRLSAARSGGCMTFLCPMGSRRMSRGCSSTKRGTGNAATDARRRSRSDTAGTNDPLYDLAAVSVFFRMDDATCLALLEAHEGTAVEVLPSRFCYFQRLVAGLCGAAFVHLARHGGFAGDSTLTVDSVVPLVDVYQRLRAGQVNVGSAGGQWMFGLALVKASYEFGLRST